MYSEETLISILRKINPDVLWTYPAVISALAGYDVSGVNPRLIFAQGSMVTQDCRDVANMVFNSELFETYGSVEFGHLAFECSEHCGLHMITSSAYIEFLDENGEYVSPGEQGEIIVTGLLNYAMPLIRYRIGDLAIPTDEKCPCRRTWPLIKKIQGRINDLIVLPSGRKTNINHLYPYIYEELKKNVFSISQYQILQEQKNRIIFKVVKGKEFDPMMLEKIKDYLEIYFEEQAENVEVVMQIVKEIPKDKSGKRRILISIIQ
jgi:phenylacetate-CoA ligase